MSITVRLDDEETANKYVTCNTCIHFHHTFKMKWQEESPVCKRRGGTTLNLVTGEIQKVNPSQLYDCEYEREGNCGEKGIHWVPRNKTKENTFKILQRGS